MGNAMGCGKEQDLTKPEPILRGERPDSLNPEGFEEIKV